MSSFVIDKKEYIKAAGIVAGLAVKYNLWIYDYETQRNSTADDFHRHFTECFEMNALSVQEQYKDETVETDYNKYFDVFNEYSRKVHTLSMNPEKLKIIIFELNRFFSSAEYQTEKEAYFWKMQTYFNRILAELMNKCLASGYELQSWGTLDI